MQSVTREISAPDGTELFIREWVGDPQADRTFVIVHGAGEHGSRYEHLAAHIVPRGWKVLAADARGHGRSKGIPTHVGSFNDYLDDLGEVLRRADLRPDRTALFGHSLGGLVVTRLIQSSRGPVAAAVVLSSPLFGLHVRIPAVKRAVGRICSWIAPATRFATELKAEQLSRSEWARKRRDEDPFSTKSVTAGWYFQVLDAAYDAWTDLARFDVPVLIQQGDADEVVDPQASVRWWCTVPAADRLLRILPGHLHELAAEPTWEETADFLLDWLDQRIPRAARLPGA
jgi:lysophospholipase